MVVDTGANECIIRKDLAQNSQVSIIWTPPCVSLQTVTGNKIHVHGKANITLRFGNIDYHHTAYIADITDPCILGLDFLKNNNFKLDFENSNMDLKFLRTSLFLAYKFNLNSTRKLLQKPTVRNSCLHLATGRTRDDIEKRIWQRRRRKSSERERRERVTKKPGS
ncbi:retrovirus-related Pol polyprotein from transposon 412 [Trichonephila clavipes]|nr:retrovirus-related Pol polyprotein from transposon 412 [Trichonephila clavipes]